MEGLVINTKTDETILQETTTDWSLYYQHVLRDYREMKKRYPFSYLTILPTVEPSIASVRVIAADIDLISDTCSVENDYLGSFSKELHILIPVKYREIGCIVFGGRWIDIKKLKEEDIHFQRDKGSFIQTKYGYSLCVGTPESFPLLENVILENVKTADNMLVAYERIMLGKTDRLGLNAFAHGNAGRIQFNKSKSRTILQRR